MDAQGWGLSGDTLNELCSFHAAVWERGTVLLMGARPQNRQHQTSPLPRPPDGVVDSTQAPLGPLETSSAARLSQRPIRAGHHNHPLGRRPRAGRSPLHARRLRPAVPVPPLGRFTVRLAARPAAARLLGGSPLTHAAAWAAAPAPRALASGT